MISRMHLRLFLIVLLISSLLLIPSAGAAHYPQSDVMISQGDGYLVFDGTDTSNWDVTNIDFETQFFLFIFTQIYGMLLLPPLPILPYSDEILLTILKIIATIITLITSGYLIILYSRRKRLENPNSRQMQILSYLSEHPGVSETEIVNATGFSRGSVSYNLRKLLQDGSVSKISSRYYPFAVCPAETEAKAEKVLGNKRRQRIFKTILENPGISQKQLSDEMQMPLSTLRWHLGKLEDANLILIESKQHMTCHSVNNVFSSEEE